MVETIIIYIITDYLHTFIQCMYVCMDTHLTEVVVILNYEHTTLHYTLTD